MITASDVFATDADGVYTPEVAVDWVAHHGTPSPLYIGRTLRYTPESGWEFGPANSDAKPEWKPLAEAPKTLRAVVKDADEATAIAEGFNADQAALYELIGPKIAKNPHGLEQARLIRHGFVTAEDTDAFTNVATTSLWALARWFTDNDYQGVLWTWSDDNAEEPRYAAVHRDKLPRLEP